ncbi:asparagine synthase-related protein, partial [Thioclava sp.]|uniref:asparagine synthetase B family protein n=1 Tax=Thioclava sp. TaxID=1933450 RepID=UPI003242F53C
MNRPALHCAIGGFADPAKLAAVPELRNAVVEASARSSVLMSGPQTTRSATGALVAADLDLTHLRDTARRLAMPPNSSAIELVAAAYDRFDDELGHVLEGAFAIAIWDPKRATLVVVRDRFGLKPVVYRANARGLALASDPEAVIAMTGERPEHDVLWITEHLSGQLTNQTRTAWKDIVRLPPGKLMHYRDGMLSPPRTWWSLEPRDLSAAEQSDEALRDALSDATGEAMSGGSAAAMLSGGLDSSSLAILASRLSSEPFPTYSLRFPSAPELDEGEYIDAVLEAGNFRPTMLNGGVGTALDPTLSDLFLTNQQQPFPGFGMVTTHTICSAARADGHAVLIDGHGGDEVIGGASFSYLNELARSGEWAKLWTLLRKLHGFAGGRGAVASFVMAYARHGGNRSAAKLAGRLQRRLFSSSDPAQPDWFSIVAPELVSRLDLRARSEAASTALYSDMPFGFATHARALAGDLTPSAFELLDRATRPMGLQLRFPFYDRRVVELCVNRSDVDKIKNGQPRALMRDAMKGILPEHVRLRSTKVDFTANNRRAMREDPQGRLRQYIDNPPERLEPYVNIARLQETARALFDTSADAGGLEVMQLWRAAWLDMWLEREERARQPIASGIEPIREVHA